MPISAVSLQGRDSEGELWPLGGLFLFILDVESISDFAGFFLGARWSSGQRVRLKIERLGV